MSDPANGTPPPNEGQPRPAAGDPMDQFAGAYAERAGLQRTSSGHVDILAAIGGIRGLAESILPGLVFLVAFTAGADLRPALLAAVGVAVVFTVLRLLQKTPLTQALAGLFGVGICAFMANRTGNAADFYVWGFVTNAAYILAMLLSIAVKWPLMGLLYGFVRGEGTAWRADAGRRGTYNVATLVLMSVLVLRLVVQMPLYFADNLVALGTTRLVMGLPLYALGLWVAWLVSKPAAVPAGGGPAPGGPAAGGPTAAGAAE